MATLAPSLRRLFNEIDAIWPHRNHGIDGWYRPVSVGHSVGHNPGHNGLVHAIDVDRRGIDPDWIIAHIHNDPNALWYIIWNRGIWSNTWGFTRHAYTLSNPHTDHTHIEIRQTTYAENWSGSWFGAASGGSIVGGAAGAAIGGTIVGGAAGAAPGYPVSQGLSAADDRDPSEPMASIAYHFNDKTNYMQNIRDYNADTMNI